jgi:uncharacterized membrane protein YdjX (TVP38/TMEM64 family)
MKPSRIALLAVLLLGAAIFIWFRGSQTLEALHAWAGGIDGGLLFAALAALPLVGFPVSVLHAVTGAKFGLSTGLLLVGVSIALQLLASYAIVWVAPDFFARRFDWLRQKLPGTTHRSLTLFTMLLPGAPYFAQNYVLAVVGVPFGIFFAYSFPIHFGRSVVGVIFGEWSGNMTPARTAVLAVYAVCVTVGCGLAFRRLRAQLRSRPPAANGPTRRA